ncbi:MAG: divergent PAP2 family protein [Candidatus Woesearchaeota archaeon]
MMAEIFIEAIRNKIVISCVIVLLFSQAIKMTIDYFNKRLTWKSIVETGGMPSSHAAVVTALTVSVWFEEGMSTVFIVCAVFAAIIIRDSFGVRQATGQNTQLIKRVIRVLNLQDRFRNIKIQEILGHTFLQVLVGVIIGIVVSVWVHLV